MVGITLTLKLGTAEYNYTGLRTDASGFFTVSVDTVPNGTYNWRTKGPKSLSTSGTVSLAGAATTQVEMGQQNAGDAVTSPSSQWNIVNATDFNTLKNQFGQGGTNLSADFDNTGVVNTSDFNWLKQNFGQAGSGSLRPGGAPGGGANKADAPSSAPTPGPASRATTETKDASNERAPAGNSNNDNSNSVNGGDSQSDVGRVNGLGNLGRPNNPNSPNVVWTRTLLYFHSDHLGSVSLVTSASASPTVVSQQEFDPWGKVRSGGVSETKRNYTGQKLDETGLLFYNARYYDPSLGRFLSTDSAISAGENTMLTVDLHETGFLNSAKVGHQQILQRGFWFQLSGNDRQEAHKPNGPKNPQALNRYTYVLNNPERSSDPTGHFIVYKESAASFALALDQLILDWDKVVQGNQQVIGTINSIANGDPTGASAVIVGAFLANLDKDNAQEMKNLLTWVASWVHWLSSDEAPNGSFLDFRLFHYLKSRRLLHGSPDERGAWEFEWEFEATVQYGCDCYKPRPPSQVIPGYPKYTYALSEDLYNRLAGYRDPAGQRPWVFDEGCLRGARRCR
jgi:RHS repeat-associated protein